MLNPWFVWRDGKAERRTIRHPDTIWEVPLPSPSPGVFLPEPTDPSQLNFCEVVQFRRIDMVGAVWEAGRYTAGGPYIYYLEESRS
jgi:hypothetical protein